MVEFTLWDIYPQPAARGALDSSLSLIAFVGGGTGRIRDCWWRARRLPLLLGSPAGYVQFFQGTPLLMQLFLAYFRDGVLLGITCSPWRRRRPGVDALRLGVSGRDLARLDPGDAAEAMGGGGTASRSLANSCGTSILPQALPDRDAADGRLSRCS